MPVSPRQFLAVSLLLGLVIGSGCGPAEEKLHRVSGTVTHEGKPIPKGLIFFDPRSDGPQGFANIVNGSYDTSLEGKGVRGGAYDVRVNGFDGKEAPEAPFGQALFPEHTGATELPAEDSKYDLNITRNR